MKKTALFLLLIGAAAFGAVPAPDFFASFDRNTDLVKAAGGSIKGTSAAAPEYASGLYGDGLRVGTNADKTQGYNVIYPAQEVINPAAGTVTLWVKAADWEVSDKIYHVFFRAKGPDADLLIYKVPNDWGCILRFLIGPTRKTDGKNIWTQISADVRDWKPGEWHFVAVTWEAGKAALIIDGRPPRTQELKVLPGTFTTCGAGGLYPTKWSGGSAGTTYLDDLKIFKRALSVAEISEVFRAR